MRTMRSLLVVSALAATSLSIQDPQPRVDSRIAAKVAAKAAAKVAVATQTTPRSQRRRPVPGRPERHRWAGVYQLRSRVVDGQIDPRPNKGYLAVTGKHVFLHLASPGTRDDRPLLHSAVRQWRQVEDAMQMTSMLDYLTDSNGDIHLVTPGKQESRRIQAVRGGLRVYQGGQSWLEFERVE